ncbi:hypothetical protein N9T04_00205 [Alphaproteobacteria bacterium]|nr:hypothetical protein [Alphaproteobacteria bacterium]MDG1003748.1 hypothetical protein [Emcibacteraceae bacterium]
MSKARARQRKKKRLAKGHQTGKVTTPAAVAEKNFNAGKFNNHLNTDGKIGGGKNIPNLATSSRGAARSG